MTKNDSPTIVISSTALDLPEHRREVMDACLQLGHQPKMMEHLGAADADAIEESLRLVDGADVYVGLLAHRYGFVPPGFEISITEPWRTTCAEPSTAPSSIAPLVPRERVGHESSWRCASSLTPRANAAKAARPKISRQRSATAAARRWRIWSGATTRRDGGQHVRNIGRPTSGGCRPRSGGDEPSGDDS